jgi:hypothetical protein
MTKFRRIVAALAAAAMCSGSAGTALAGEFNVNPNGTYVPAHRSANETAQTQNGQAPTGGAIVRVSASSGFNWGDAGIGVGAGLAIAALLLGGGLALTQHRPVSRTRRA